MSNCKDCHALSCANERTTLCKKHKPKRKQSNGFCFTVNNYDDEDMFILSTFYENDPNCTYLIYGKEKGKSGTPHLQGYIYFKKKMDLNKIIKQFSPWHVEAQGSAKNVKAYAYCMEDGDYTEFGERPRQGHRTDLEVIKHDLKKGKSIKDVSNEYFSQWCQYSRQFDRFKQIHKPINTKIMCYDTTQLKKQFDIIRTEYSNYYIYNDQMRMLDVMIMKDKGIYDYIFIPNVPLFIDGYDDCIDGYIF